MLCTARQLTCRTHEARLISLKDLSTVSRNTFSQAVKVNMTNKVPFSEVKIFIRETQKYCHTAGGRRLLRPRRHGAVAPPGAGPCRQGRWQDDAETVILLKLQWLVLSRAHGNETTVQEQGQDAIRKKACTELIGHVMDE